MCNKYVRETVLKGNLCALKVFLCALVSRPVYARTQLSLRGNIAYLFILFSFTYRQYQMKSIPRRDKQSSRSVNLFIIPKDGLLKLLRELIPHFERVNMTCSISHIILLSLQSIKATTFHEYCIRIHIDRNNCALNLRPDSKCSAKMLYDST